MQEVCVYPVLPLTTPADSNFAILERRLRREGLEAEKYNNLEDLLYIAVQAQGHDPDG